MLPIKVELLKALETAPDHAVEQTFEYLKSILSKKSLFDESQEQADRRSRWIDRLRQNRARLPINENQTVIEMRREERF
jgi:hypothetical protein